MKKVLIFLSVIFVLISCKKNEEFGPHYTNENFSEIEKVLKGVLVINEGNFGFGNASLSAIDFENGTVQNMVFENVNAKPLGDVGQYVLVVDSVAFVVVNNSNVIYAINLSNFKIVQEIVVAGAPRYLVKHENELLVSSMGANSVQAINISDYSLSTKIAINNWGWLEEMVVVENKLFACNRTNHSVDIVNLKDNLLISQLKAGRDPESIIVDSLGKIWVLATGGFDVNKREKARISKVSSSGNSLEMVFQFSDIENSPTRLRLSKNGDKAYFLNNGIFEFDVLNMGSPISIYSQNSGQLFYGLGVNPVNGNLFIGNAKDYVSKGEVIEINSKGILKRKFESGIIPQSFGFY